MNHRKENGEDVEEADACITCFCLSLNYSNTQKAHLIWRGVAQPCNKVKQGFRRSELVLNLYHLA